MFHLNWDKMSQKAVAFVKDVSRAQRKCKCAPSTPFPGQNLKYRDDFQIGPSFCRIFPPISHTLVHAHKNTQGTVFFRFYFIWKDLYVPQIRIMNSNVHFSLQSPNQCYSNFHVMRLINSVLKLQCTLVSYLNIYMFWHSVSSNRCAELAALRWNLQHKYLSDLPCVF